MTEKDLEHYKKSLNQNVWSDQSYEEYKQLVITFITTIESQKEEIERMKLQIRRAHLSLSWSNTENQIPHAIYYLEQAVPVEPDSPEYIEAAKIFLQEGEKP